MVALVDLALEGADLGARPDAGPRDPAAAHPHHRSGGGRRAGKAAPAADHALTDGLNGLGDRPGLAIVLGAVLGLMMAFDMGGPLNKTAYAFATTGLGAAATSTDAPELKVMAAVMLAGMVPPIALALATVVRPATVHQQEQENGKAAWLMGA